MIRHKCSTEDELREKRTESWEAPRLDSVLRKHHYHQGGAATVDDFQTASNWTNGPKVTQKTKQQQTRQGHTICYSLALYSCNSLHDWSRYRLVGQKENCKRLNFFGLSSCIHIFKRELLMLIHVSFHVRIPLLPNRSFVHIWPHCFFRTLISDLIPLTYMKVILLGLTSLTWLIWFDSFHLIWLISLDSTCLTQFEFFNPFNLI